MFKEKKNPTTTVKAIASLTPKVGIRSDALIKMKIYVEECNDEIGWLGTVQELGNRQYIIDDVFLFEQDVHGATTEITPDGLSKFGEELMTKPDGMDIWNNLKMWGHSHVNMSITPSGQDDKQMEEFESIGQNWFLRLICNKRGDMKIDLFDYENGITYLDVIWVELASKEEEIIKKQIEELQTQLEAFQETKEDQYKSVIEAEIEEKVSKMVDKTHSVSIGKDYPRGYGYWQSGAWVSYDDNDKELPEKKNWTRGK